MAASKRKGTPFIRAAHGAKAKGGALTDNESIPWDEMPAASPADTDRAERGPDGRFLPGNRTAKNKRIRPSNHGALTALEAQADPIWRACNNWGKRYSSHRRAELTRAHGGELSAGVSAMIESAAQALADARYLRAKGAAANDPELMKVAATMTKDARQAERDAWALAALESASRPQVDPTTALIRRIKGGDQ